MLMLPESLLEELLHFSSQIYLKSKFSKTFVTKQLLPKFEMNLFDSDSLWTHTNNPFIIFFVFRVNTVVMYSNMLTWIRMDFCLEW